MYVMGCREPGAHAYTIFWKKEKKNWVVYIIHVWNFDHLHTTQHNTTQPYDPHPTGCIRLGKKTCVKSWFLELSLLRVLEIFS